MAKNTYKNQAEPKPKAPSKKNLFDALGNAVNIESAVESLPKYLKFYALWVCFLLFIMIFFTHQYEGQLREIDNLKKEIDNKRAEYVFKKANYMRNTKKSTMLQQLEKQGIIENKKRPIKILIED